MGPVREKAAETRPAPSAVDDPAGAPWPAGAADSTRVWPTLLASCGLVAALLTLLLLQNRRYFYVDDRIAETIPKLVDVGRLLRAGEPPWLTTGIVNGGGYAVEYLNGVFNPLNLALAVVVSGMSDLALASYVYVLAHCLLLTAGGAWLVRSLGLRTGWAVAVAVSIGFQPYTVLWNATAWSQGLLAFAWAVLAVAAAVAFSLRPRRRYGWVVLAATYGCLTSGWPLAVFVLGVFAAALLVARLVQREDRAATGWLAAWFAGGAVCSLVAVIPLLTAFEVADRKGRTSNLENFNVTPVEGLLHAADPA